MLSTALFSSACESPDREYARFDAGTDGTSDASEGTDARTDDSGVDTDADAGDDGGGSGGADNDAGQDADVDAAEPMPCAGDDCAPCSPEEEGLRRCSLNFPQACNDGRWEDQDPCGGDTPRCLEGACVCSPGALGCLGGNRVERCTAAGTWEVDGTCPADRPICNDGHCECVDGINECPDAVTARTCVDGTWQYEACVNSTPACVNGACVQCEVGASRCIDGKAREVCSQTGTWQPQTCPVVCWDGACVDPREDSDLIGCDYDTPLICAGALACCGPGNCYDPNHSTCPQGQGLRGECDGPSDCPGGVCCYQSDPGGIRMVCTTPEDCVQGTMYLKRRVCRLPHSPCPTGFVCQEVDAFVSACVPAE